VTIRAGKPATNVTRGDVAEIVVILLTFQPIRINEGALGELSVGFYFSPRSKLDARTVVVMGAKPLTTK
jgi:hypothetical protein